jgi:hypothetical protein
MTPRSRPHRRIRGSSPAEASMSSSSTSMSTSTPLSSTSTPRQSRVHEADEDAEAEALEAGGDTQRDDDTTSTAVTMPSCAQATANGSSKEADIKSTTDAGGDQTQGKMTDIAWMEHAQQWCAQLVRIRKSEHKNKPELQSKWDETWRERESRLVELFIAMAHKEDPGKTIDRVCSKIKFEDREKSFLAGHKRLIGSEIEAVGAAADDSSAPTRSLSAHGTDGGGSKLASMKHDELQYVCGRLLVQVDQLTKEVDDQKKSENQLKNMVRQQQKELRFATTGARDAIETRKLCFGTMLRLRALEEKNDLVNSVSVGGQVSKMKRALSDSCLQEQPNKRQKGPPVASRVSGKWHRTRTKSGNISLVNLTATGTTCVRTHLGVQTETPINNRGLSTLSTTSTSPPVPRSSSSLTSQAKTTWSAVPMGGVDIAADDRVMATYIKSEPKTTGGMNIAGADRDDGPRVVRRGRGSVGKPHHESTRTSLHRFAPMKHMVMPLVTPLSLPMSYSSSTREAKKEDREFGVIADDDVIMTQLRHEPETKLDIVVDMTDDDGDDGRPPAPLNDGACDRNGGSSKRSPLQTSVDDQNHRHEQLVRMPPAILPWRASSSTGRLSSEIRGREAGEVTGDEAADGDIIVTRVWQTSGPMVDEDDDSGYRDEAMQMIDEMNEQNETNNMASSTMVNERVEQDGELTEVEEEVDGQQAVIVGIGGLRDELSTHGGDGDSKAHVARRTFSKLFATPTHNRTALTATKGISRMVVTSDNAAGTSDMESENDS